MARPRLTHQKVVEGLFKRCKHLDWRKCDCPWYGIYRSVKVSLTFWWGPIDSYETAGKALLDFKWAVEHQTYVKGQKKNVPTEKKADQKTFGEIIDAYDAWSSFATDAVKYELAILKKELGNEPVEALAKDPLKVNQWFTDFIKRRNAERKKKKLSPLKPRSVNAFRIRGCAIFSWARPQMPTLNLISNPFELLPTPKGVSAERKSRFTFAQLKDIYAAVPKLSIPRNGNDKVVGPLAAEMKIRFLIALLSGIRESEMLEIRLPQVDFTDWTIHLPAPKTKGGKTTGKDETLYLDWLEDDPEIGKWVEDLKAELKKRKFLKEPHDFICGREYGGQIASFERTQQRLFELAGLTWTRELDEMTGKPLGYIWHDLRHEAISRAAELYGDPWKVMAFARHKDIKTSQLYVEMTKERLQKARKAARA